MTGTIKNTLNIIQLLLLLAIAVCDVWAGSLLFSGMATSMLFGSCAHIVLVVLFSLLMTQVRIYHRRANPNLFWVSVVMSAAIPAYGMSAMTIIFFIINLVREKPVQITDSFVDDPPQPVTAELRKTIQSAFDFKRDELQIDAFRDVFRHGDQSLEERTIQKLAAMADKQSVRILCEIVRHSTSDSRILAASALLGIENKITRRIEALKDHMEYEPGDLAAVLKAARTYDLYCYLDMLSPEITKHYQKLAITHYEKYLLADPGHPEATFELGRILLNSNRFEEARTVLEKAIKMQPENPRAILWLAEVYYETGEFARVTEICHRAARLGFMPERLRKVTEWWTNPASGAEQQEQFAEPSA